MSGRAPGEQQTKCAARRNGDACHPFACLSACPPVSGPAEPTPLRSLRGCHPALAPSAKPSSSSAAPPAAASCHAGLCLTRRARPSTRWSCWPGRTPSLQGEGGRGHGPGLDVCGGNAAALVQGALPLQADGCYWSGATDFSDRQSCWPDCSTCVLPVPRGVGRRRRRLAPARLRAWTRASTAAWRSARRRHVRSCCSATGRTRSSCGSCARRSGRSGV